MKIRNGFVSNSSSSSFTCAVCNRSEGGYDASLRDFDMSECTAGHTFCDEERQNPDNEDHLPRGYDVDVKYCPICSFKEIASDDVFDYLVKKTGMTIEQITQEIKTSFANYKEFQAFKKE